MDIGISEQDRKLIAEQLSNLLADSYPLYLKMLRSLLEG